MAQILCFRGDFGGVEQSGGLRLLIVIFWFAIERQLQDPRRSASLSRSRGRLRSTLVFICGLRRSAQSWIVTSIYAPDLANSTALTNAWALLRHSSYSLSGTESATMPAPA